MQPPSEDQNNLSNGNKSTVSPGSVPHHLSLQPLNAHEYSQPYSNQMLDQFSQQQMGEALSLSPSQIDEYNRLLVNQVNNGMGNSLHVLPQSGEDSRKTGHKRKRATPATGSRKRRKIDPKEARFKEVIVRFIFRNLDRPIHSTYVSKCATHKKCATVVKDIFWELSKKGYGKTEKWRDTENSSLFFYKNEALNEKSQNFDEGLLQTLCNEYGIEKSDVSDGFRVSTKGPDFKNKINTGRWSKDEHEAFLRGLAEYGRTNYRLIAQNYVRTRITQQVAEYSERYFAGKRKKEKGSANGTRMEMRVSQPPPPSTMEMLAPQIVQIQQLQQLALLNPQFAQQFQNQINQIQEQIQHQYGHIESLQGGQMIHSNLTMEEEEKLLNATGAQLDAEHIHQLQQFHDNQLGQTHHSQQLVQDDKVGSTLPEPIPLQMQPNDDKLGVDDELGMMEDHHGNIMDEVLKKRSYDHSF